MWRFNPSLAQLEVADHPKSWTPTSGLAAQFASRRSPHTRRVRAESCAQSPHIRWNDDGGDRRLEPAGPGRATDGTVDPSADPVTDRDGLSRCGDRLESLLGLAWSASAGLSVAPRRHCNPQPGGETLAHAPATHRRTVLGKLRIAAGGWRATRIPPQGLTVASAWNVRLRCRRRARTGYRPRRAPPEGDSMGGWWHRSSPSLQVGGHRLPLARSGPCQGCRRFQRSPATSAARSLRYRD